MRIINITPLLFDHLPELAADLRQLQKNCGVTDVAFMMPLVPEEYEPKTAKAERLRDLFLQAREMLNGSGLKVGILLQSLIGHGVPTQARFQRSVNSNGVVTHSMCPLDHDFQEYVRNVVTIEAQTRPDFLLVDDDFRLTNCGGSGCFCQLHLAGFNRLQDSNYNRESLISELAQNKTLQEQWDAFRGESLYALARVIRQAIDTAGTDLPCGLCIGHPEGTELQFAVANAKILAGNNPPFIRIGNSFYLDNNPAGLLYRVYWTAMQMQAVNTIPEILAESDTYPHNRYCTSAKALNGQIIYSLLNGVTGSKLWMTRTAEYEPGSGLAYRENMRQHAAAYRQLQQLYPAIAWDEPLTPLPRQVPPQATGIRENNWTSSICGRMGIPARVGDAKGARVIMLSGPEIDFFDDRELTDFLSRSVLLDGNAAEKLCRRGFSGLLGVDVDAPADWSVSQERMTAHIINGNATGKKISLTSFTNINVKRVNIKNKAVKVLSELYHVPWYGAAEREKTGLGVTLFENSSGGRVAVFAATIGFMEYMNEVRREQLVNVLDWLNASPLPIVVDSDVDVYTRHGTIEESHGGGELLAVFNLNVDSLPELRLRIGGMPIKTISRLNGNGTWSELPWQMDTATGIVIGTPLETMQPMILRIRRK